MLATDRASQPAACAVTSALDGSRRDLDELLRVVGASKHDVTPFDAGVTDLCSALSGRLLRLREHPEAVSLGFWMRPASISALQAEFERAVPPSHVVGPRGLAVHITPANVDTMFVYSWVLALLMGNASIVRLSSRASTARDDILEAIAATLDEPRFAVHAARNSFILTDHAEATAAALSLAADVRIVWGGNATVEHFRRYPIPIHGRDVAFPDRHSLALLDANAVLELDDAGLRKLAEAFFNDAFWFDQGACSSPRLIVWRAASAKARTEVALERFHEAVVGAIERRGYVAETGIALSKMAFATAMAARVDGVRIVSPSNEVHWVRLPGLGEYDRENCGGGLFFEIISHDIEADLLSLVSRRDQTITAFGVDGSGLQHLARALNGRGVDRIVPVGEALAFSATWDGLDLLHEFSRRTVVDVRRSA